MSRLLRECLLLLLLLVAIRSQPQGPVCPSPLLDDSMCAHGVHDTTAVYDVFLTDLFKIFNFY